MPDLSYDVTKMMLVDLMFSKDTARFTYKEKLYIFQGMTRESGNGRCFNVVGRDEINGRTHVFFFRTLD
jgi:hypothetical protein